MSNRAAISKTTIDFAVIAALEYVHFIGLRFFILVLLR